ncbi:MAG: acyl-ACP--UDP-N-acetylglucosamine O-acyltransferase [Deltaproteobacteria bacterium]|nr:acyl-ACP--UDP-N-acetylglucosamine O-acyltransferase [Deltaproteobacteria bacterium]
MIDPTAVVHPTAELDSGVTVGPYSVIGEGARIGKNSWIGPHVVVGEWTTVGGNCRIYQFASVGAPPQDRAYKGEPTETIIGDNNVIREFVTIHRGTMKDRQRTVCGSDNLLMNYVHVAHDCTVGNNVIMANSATLAGHVTIEDFAIVGGLVAVHQHVKIGAYCIIGGASAVSKDIPPYVMAVGNRARLYGLNWTGLKRHGFSRDEMEEIKRSYHILFRSSLTLKEAVKRLKGELAGSVHAQRFLRFIENSKRGIARERTAKKHESHEE